MAVPTNLGGGLRSALMINETAWNAGTVYPQTGCVRFFQRVGTAYTLTVAGRYKGSAPTTVQVRIIDADTSATVVDWATLDAAPASNAFTGTVSVPQGNLDGSHRYKVQVRDSGNTAVVVTSYSVIVVGICVLVMDQSNGLKKFGGQNRTPGGLTASPGTYCVRGSLYTAAYPINAASGTDDPSANNGNDGFGGDGWVSGANQFVAVARIPLCIKECSIGSTTITTWRTDGTATSWNNVLLNLGRAAADSQFEAVYGLVPGESDGVVGTAKATYKTGVTQVYSQVLTLCGRAHIPVVIEIVGRDVSATAANMDAIRQGQLEVVDADATGDLSLSLRTDQYNSQQDPHFFTSQYVIFGCRAACELLFRLGFTSVGMRGLKCASITASAADQSVTLTVTPDGGSALRDSNGSPAGSGLTPFRIFNGVTQKTISTTAFASATTIKFTLPGGSFVNGDTINLDHMQGQPTVNDPNAGTGNCVYDNLTVPGTSLGRPLQPSRGQLSCTAGA